MAARRGCARRFDHTDPLIRSGWLESSRFRPAMMATGPPGGNAGVCAQTRFDATGNRTETDVPLPAIELKEISP
jgi:hypothetical protein